MNATGYPRRERRRRRRLAAPLRLLLAVAVGAMLFAVGVAVGESLHDNPQPGLTTTQVSTLAHP